MCSGADSYRRLLLCDSEASCDRRCITSMATARDVSHVEVGHKRGGLSGRLPLAEIAVEKNFWHSRIMCKPTDQASLIDADFFS